MRIKAALLCAMMFLCSFLVTFMTLSYGGCASTAAPGPSIASDLAPVALQIAADDAFAAGSIDAAQHTAATAIITQLNADLASGNGALTPADITSLVEEAALEINSIYFPAIASAPPTTVRLAIRNCALAAKAKIKK